MNRLSAKVIVGAMALITLSSTPTALVASAASAAVTPTIATMAAVPAATARAQVQTQVLLPTPNPFVILTLGDSITTNGAWQAELCRLMTQDAGVTCDIRNVAVTGTGCNYWPSRIVNLLNTHHPHAVTLFCGTNDNGNTAAGRNDLGTAFRLTVEATYTYQTTPRITILPSWIQYSDVLTLPQNLQYLTSSEPQVNDELYRNMQYYAPAGWFPAGIADFQQIPGTAQFMNEDCPGCAGIHPNDRGYRAMGRIVYDRFASAYGWPPSSELPLCNMYGHRLGTGPAPYIHCAG